MNLFGSMAGYLLLWRKRGKRSSFLLLAAIMSIVLCGCEDNNRPLAAPNIITTKTKTTNVNVGVPFVRTPAVYPEPFVIGQPSVIIVEPHPVVVHPHVEPCPPTHPEHPHNEPHEPHVSPHSGPSH